MLHICLLPLLCFACFFDILQNHLPRGGANHDALGSAHRLSIKEMPLQTIWLGLSPHLRFLLPGNSSCVKTKTIVKQDTMKGWSPWLYPQSPHVGGRKGLIPESYLAFITHINSQALFHGTPSVGDIPPRVHPASPFFWPKAYSSGRSALGCWVWHGIVKWVAAGQKSDPQLLWGIFYEIYPNWG